MKKEVSDKRIELVIIMEVGMELKQKWDREIARNRKIEPKAGLQACTARNMIVGTTI